MISRKRWGDSTWVHASHEKVAAKSTRGANRVSKLCKGLLYYCVQPQRKAWRENAYINQMLPYKIFSYGWRDREVCAVLIYRQRLMHSLYMGACKIKMFVTSTCSDERLILSPRGVQYIWIVFFLSERLPMISTASKRAQTLGIEEVLTLS